MGFFGKIKANLNHGGVKVSLSVPPKVSAADQSLNAQLGIVADQPQQINKVTVKFIRTSYDNSVETVQGTGQQVRNDYTLGSFVREEPFTLQVNTPVSLPVYIPFQLNAQLPASMPGAAQVTGILDRLQKVENLQTGKSYSYSVTALVDVEGIALDPADSKPIEVSGENQI